MQKFIALVAALAFGGAACSNLPESKQAKLDLLRCQAEAIAPAVEPVFDAGQVALDVSQGKAKLADVLRAVGASQADVKAVLARLKACEPKPATAADAGAPPA